MKRERFPVSGGFSYAETLMTMLILALCAGLIGDAITFGVRQFQRRTRLDEAVILLDTLCAVVRNDLQYATNYYDDHSFERTVRDYAVRKDYSVRTWYGIAPQRADNAEWLEIHDSAARPGQLVRKSEISDGQFFFDCVTESESGAPFCVALDITPELDITLEVSEKIDFFSVSLRIYDGPDDGAELLAGRDFSIMPVQPIPFTVLSAPE